MLCDSGHGRVNWWALGDGGDSQSELGGGEDGGKRIKEDGGRVEQEAIV